MWCCGDSDNDMSEKPDIVCDWSQAMGNNGLPTACDFMTNHKTLHSITQHFAVVVSDEWRCLSKNVFIMNKLHNGRGQTY